MENSQNNNNNNISSSSNSSAINLDQHSKFKRPSGMEIADGVVKFRLEHIAKLERCQRFQQLVLDRNANDIADMDRMISDALGSSTSFTQQLMLLSSKYPLDTNLHLLEDILHHYEMEQNGKIKGEQIVAHWAQRVTPTEQTIASFIEGLMSKGRTDDFRITVLQIVPNQYVLLDGAHRVCAWQIMCAANPELKFNFTAQIIAPTLSLEQIEVISGGKNDLPHKTSDVLDSVYWFWTKRDYLRSRNEHNAQKVLWIHSIKGSHFITNKASNSTPGKKITNKSSEVRMMQKYLQLADMLDQPLFDKMLQVHHVLSMDPSRKIKLSRENVLQAPFFHLADFSVDIAREAYTEYLMLFENAKHPFNAEQATMIITHKYYLKLQITKHFPVATAKLLLSVLGKVPLDNWEALIPPKLIKGDHIRSAVLDLFETLLGCPSEFQTFLYGEFRSRNLQNAMDFAHAENNKPELLNSHLETYVAQEDLPAGHISNDLILHFNNHDFRLSLVNSTVQLPEPVATTEPILVADFASVPPPSPIVEHSLEFHVVTPAQDTADPPQPDAKKPTQSGARPNTLSNTLHQRQNELPANSGKIKQFHWKRIFPGATRTISGHPFFPFFGLEFLMIKHEWQSEAYFSHQTLGDMCKLMGIQHNGKRHFVVLDLQEKYMENVREMLGITEEEFNKKFISYSPHHVFGQAYKDEPAPEATTPIAKTRSSTTNNNDNNQSPSLSNTVDQPDESASKNQQPKEPKTSSKKTNSASEKNKRKQAEEDLHDISFYSETANLKSVYTLKISGKIYNVSCDDGFVWIKVNNRRFAQAVKDGNAIYEDDDGSISEHHETFVKPQDNDSNAESSIENESKMKKSKPKRDHQSKNKHRKETESTRQEKPSKKTEERSKKRGASEEIDVSKKRPKKRSLESDSESGSDEKLDDTQ